ncbi:uncharacterized protein LOC130998722 [Salvia miltiorrhiza]|uniref:uncharacterized protein LOC130998722 n=1 Tax=Salvia miltiorrhiza TaxID=226208 RepID=UPI0025AC7A0E|nr:uncharacterized protein LOC130998722 [Salvia miltiorrhiza]
MGIMLFSFPTIVNPVINKGADGMHKFAKIESSSNNLQLPRRRRRQIGAGRRLHCSISRSNGDEEQLDSPQELRVPSHWLEPSRAAEESAWLRSTLQKWLDEEYCPEATNVEISKIAADSLYKSLVEKRSDLGDILLKMAVELESISYQDSFHGAFSSANAAVNLIVQRILHD